MEYYSRLFRQPSSLPWRRKSAAVAAGGVGTSGQSLFAVPARSVNAWSSSSAVSSSSSSTPLSSSALHLSSSSASSHAGPSWIVRISIIALLTLFVSSNLYYSAQINRDERRINRHIRSRGDSPWVTTSSQPFNHNGVAQKAKRLIMVAGHSVTISGHLEDAGKDERDWYLLDYQRHKGLPQAILAHIQAGIRQAALDPEALLVFSGGETRSMTGPDTEGMSYYRVADAMNLWPQASTVRARTVSEEFATDSFENFMFSICRFREVTGSYPEKITIVSFTFKQRRFETLHAAALQWPLHRLDYIGVDPPASSSSSSSSVVGKSAADGEQSDGSSNDANSNNSFEFNLEEATKGELENAAKPFEKDPYGCHSEILQKKRKERNPFFRTPPYRLSCPEMQDLLEFCGPELISKDKVPWKSLWS